MKIKVKIFETLYKKFRDYAWKEYGRLETRLDAENYAKWLDWRTNNPDKEFYRFERFL